jgi:hypothetical protein
LPFQAHLELLQFFLAHRAHIVERVQALLNAQRKPIEYLQDGSVLSRHFEDCFFIGATQSQSQLRGQLEETHWADGFRPRELQGLHNGLIDPAELMIRGFHLWQETRWPGRNGRVHYAHALFNLYVVRCLELLSMRLWDEGAGGAGDRLSELQKVLDRLWQTDPADQPVFVRDARWLIPLAQSPATDDLGAYFKVAEKVARTLPEADRIEISKAGVCMAGGHLRSQIRHHSVKRGVPLDEQRLVLNARNTNALDFALMIQDLVPLLDAYERACSIDDEGKRIELADAICQGISPDPELFLNRVGLLGAYSMIEHLFATADHDGQVAYTSMGARHVQLLQEYEARIGRVSKHLADDCPRFRPVAGTYSPYGVLYGFSTDLIEHMALKTVTPDAVNDFSLEDVFAGNETGTKERRQGVPGDQGKLAWVSGWRKLPHLKPEVVKLFDYPQQFAEDIFGRIEQALRKRVSGGEMKTGRLLILPADNKEADLTLSPAPEDETQILSDRQEGRSVVSFKTPAGWISLSKSVLTEALGEGRDVKIAGLTPEAAEVLKLMAPSLVVLV